MAEYAVTASNGKTYKIEGPPGAPEAYVRDVVERRLRLANTRLNIETPVDRTMGGYAKEVAKGIPSGIASMLESTAVGASGLLPEDMERSARRGIESVAAPVQDYLAPARGYEDSIVRKGAEALGSTIPFLATAGLGAVAIPAGIAAGVAAGSGEAVQRAEAKGATPEQVSQAAVSGIIPGALEFLPPLRIFRRAVGDKVASGIVNKLKEIAMAGGEEGLQEATTEIAQNLIARGIYDPSQGVFTNTGESAGYGAGVGALMQILTDMVVPGKSRAPGPTPPPAAGDIQPEDQGPIQPDMFGDAPVMPPEGPIPGPAAGPTLAAMSTDDLFPEDLAATMEAGPRQIPRPDAAPVSAFDRDRQFVTPQTDVAAELPQTVLDAELRAGQQRRKDLLERQQQERQTEAGDLFPRELAQAQQAPVAKPGSQDEPVVETAQVRNPDQMDIEEQITASRLEEQKAKTAKAIADQKAAAFSAAELAAQKVAAKKPAQEEKAFEAIQAEAAEDVVGAETKKSLAQEAFNAAPTPMEKAIADARAAARASVVPLDEGVSNVPVEELPTIQKLADEQRQSEQVLDAPRLDVLGIPKSAGVYKRTAGKNLADPVVREAVSVDLAKYGKQYAKPDVARRIEGFLGSELFVAPAAPQAVQGEMFDNRGRIKTQPLPVAAEPVAPMQEAAVETAAEPVAPVDTTPKRVAKMAKSVQVTPEPVQETAESIQDKYDINPRSSATLMRREEVAESGDDARSPWLLADGEIMGTNGDHIDVFKEGVDENYAGFMRRTGAVRSAFFKDKSGKYAIMLHVAPGQTLTDTQWDTVAALRDAQTTPVVIYAGASESKNPEYKEVALGADLSKVSERAASTKKGLKPEFVAAEKAKVQAASDKLAEAKQAAPAEPKTGKAEPSPYKEKPKKKAPPAKVTDKKQAFVHTASKEEVNTDPEIIKSVQKAAKGTDPTTSAANQYFVGHPTPRDALHVLAADLVLGSNTAKAKQAKQWVDENMSESGKAALQAEIDYFQKMDSAGRQYSRGRKAIEDQIADYEHGDELYLREDALMAVRVPLHPDVVVALMGNKLRAALQLLRKSANPDVARVAAALEKKLGDTKVEVYDSVIENEKGVAGKYDPKTDTITISLESGRNAHVLLHEVTHALTSHILANKSHPITIKLNKLFNDIKGQLDTAYGAESLDEFVAEAFSNPEFQAKLAGMPAGDATAWQKLKNTIRNFVASLMGLPHKPLESAKSRADTLIESILSPAPATRSAAELYSTAINGNPKGLVESLGDMVNNKDPGSYDRGLAQVKSFLKPASDKTSEAVLDLLQLHSVVDIIKDVIPSAVDVLNVFEEQGGARQRALQLIKVTGDNIRNNFNGRDKERAVFNDVVHRSTRFQVDPSHADGATRYKGDKEKLQDYTELRAIWNTMPKQDRDAYVRLRNTYSEMYNQIRDALLGRVDALTEDAEQRKTIKTKLLDMLTRRKIEPFFPLHREGDYRLSYNAPDPRTGNMELFVEHFETDIARTQAIQALEADESIGATDIEAFEDMSKINYERVPTSFLYQMMQQLQTSKTRMVADANGKLVEESYTIPTDVVNSFMEMVLAAMPESSFSRGFHHREGRGRMGYQGDALAVYDKRGPALAHQLVNIQYDSRLEDVRRKVTEEAKAARKQDANAPRYLARLNDYINFAKNPKLSTWSRALRSLTFGWTLGFNVSSVVVNATNIPTVVAPFLAGRFGIVKSMKALAAAYKTYAATGSMRDVELMGTTTDAKGKVVNEKVKVRAGWSTGNWDFTDPDTQKRFGRFQTLIELADSRGQLTRSTASEVMEYDNPMYSTWGKVNSYMGFLMHHGERMNRQITMLAAYDLRLQEFEKGGKQATTAQKTEAAEYALSTTELTNSGSLITTGPRLAQKGNGLGSLVMMYKRFGVSMYYMQYKMAREALRGADPETRAIARRQIAGLFASSAFMAGARGLPLYGIMQMLWDMFLTDDDEPDFNTLAADFFGEGIYSGALNAITGTDVAARIGMTNLMFRSLPNKEQDSVVLYALEQLGGPVFGLASRLESGAKLINEGQVWRGLENAMPSTLANLGKGTRYATEGVLTLRGDEITGEVTPWSATAQALGFAPADYIQQLERNSVIKKIDRSVNTRRTNLLRKYYMAFRQGDTQEMRAVEADMQELSQEHPGAAITGATIKRSLRAHRKTSEETRKYNGITVSKNVQSEIDALIEDLDD